jgi:hypothetical protein
MVARQSFDAWDRDWVPPAGLHRSSPRQVNLSPRGKLLAAVIIALIAGGVGVAVGLGRIAARDARDEGRLAAEGVVTKAVVTRLWRARDKSQQSWMQYQFAADGTSHEANVRVPLQMWRELRPGADVAVRYVPSNPHINHPTAFKMSGMPGWVSFMVACVTSVVALFRVLAVSRQRRMLMEGRPAPGRVIKHGKVRRGPHGQNQGQQYHYEFRLVSGGIARGRGGPDKHPPEVGSLICVLYDPDDPKRNLPYPLSLVELAKY